MRRKYETIKTKSIMMFKYIFFIYDNNQVAKNVIF